MGLKNEKDSPSERIKYASPPLTAHPIPPKVSSGQRSATPSPPGFNSKDESYQTPFYLQALPTERTQQHQTRNLARPGLFQANIKTANMYILGNFLYIAVLLINAIAVLSEDRFLARTNRDFLAVNLSPSSYDPTFGSSNDASVKAKIINLIASVRTLMRIPLIGINTIIILYELILG
ncbi:hypothetical protein Landi51_00635 [Colletotrichum acutatum]